MPDLAVRINGQVVHVPPRTTVAAAIARRGAGAFAPHAPLCGMGVCFQCRVTVDGTPHRLACQTLCRDGMEVVTG